MIKPIVVRCPEEFKFLQPRVVSDLFRVGNASDGGYVMTSIAISNSKYFLSLGLGENWSFEKAVSEKNLNASIDIYDDTVSLAFFAKKALKGLVKFVFMKDSITNLCARITRWIKYYHFWYISSKNTHHRTRITKNSFREIISRYSLESRIGLKVDIEGSEWEILELIAQNQSLFEFVLIEIHNFEEHESDLRKFLMSLDKGFVIAHLHANNFEGLGKNGFPRVFELTLLKKANAKTTDNYRQRLPIADLDAPNAKNRADFFIDFT